MNKFITTPKLKKFTKLFLGIVVFSTLLLPIIYYSSAYKRSNNKRRVAVLLYQFYRAQTLYRNSFGQGNYASSAIELDQFDWRTFHREVFHMQVTPCCGYLLGPIKITSKSDSSEATFAVTAYPVKKIGFLRTGDDCFYIDQTGILRHSGSPTKIPDANSPPVE